MAGKRGVRVVILGEDNRQVSFARRVLMQLGFSAHEITTRPVPDGDGSGAQRVQADYPEQMAVNRCKRTHQQCTLLVSIDRDNQSIEARKQYFDGILTARQMPPRADGEPVAIWVPSRNIETWIRHFSGEVVNEADDYKGKVRNLNLKQTAEGFVAEFRQWQQSSKGLRTLPSLIDAYEELARIL